MWKANWQNPHQKNFPRYLKLSQQGHTCRGKDPAVTLFEKSLLSEPSDM